MTTRLAAMYADNDANPDGGFEDVGGDDDAGTVVDGDYEALELEKSLGDGTAVIDEFFH